MGVGYTGGLTPLYTSVPYAMRCEMENARMESLRARAAAEAAEEAATRAAEEAATRTGYGQT